MACSLLVVIIAHLGHGLPSTKGSVSSIFSWSSCAFFVAKFHHWVCSATKNANEISKRLTGKAFSLY